MARRATTEPGQETDKDIFSALRSDTGGNTGLRNTATAGGRLQTEGDNNDRDFTQSAQTRQQSPDQQQPDNESPPPEEALQELAKLREVIKPPRTGNTGEDAIVNDGGEELAKNLGEKIEQAQEQIDQEGDEPGQRTGADIDGGGVSGTQFALSAGIAHIGIVTAGTTLGLPPGLTSGASTVMTLHDTYRFMKGDGDVAENDGGESVQEQLDAAHEEITELEDGFAEKREIDPEDIELTRKGLSDGYVKFGQGSVPVEATNSLTENTRSVVPDQSTTKLEPDPRQIAELGGPEATMMMPG